MNSEGNPSHSSNIHLEQAHEIGRALIRLQEQGNPPYETLIGEAIMVALLTSNTLPPMKTLIMRKGDQED